MPPVFMRFIDDPRQMEKLRRCSQPGPFDGRFVDVESDVIVLGGDQADHPALLRELIDVADCEHRSPAQYGEDPPQIPPLRGTDEDNVALEYFFDPAQRFDADRSPLHGLISYHLGKKGPERILADHADHKRSGGVSANRSRPSNVGRELVDEGRLDLVLRRRRRGDCLRNAQPRGQQQRPVPEDATAGHHDPRPKRLTRLTNTPRPISVRVDMSVNSPWLLPNRFWPVTESSTPRRGFQP